jgi:hypothetical protein
MATDKSFLDDQESLRALIEAMPPDERAAYKGYGAMGLESAFPGRKMVVYTLNGGQPSDIDVITFGAFMCDWDNGPNAEVADSRGKTQLLTIPKRIRPRDVFLHIPQNFSLKYKGRQGADSAVDFVSHYAVLVKTRSKEIHQVDGHTYCVTLNKFRERFPDLKIRY